MTSPSSLWRFIRFASETYFTEIRFEIFKNTIHAEHHLAAK